MIIAQAALYGNMSQCLLNLELWRRTPRLGYIYVYTCIYIYIYMYRERERDHVNIIIIIIINHDMITSSCGAGPPPRSVGVVLGWHYLSNATCLIRPHLLYALFIVSRVIISCHIIRHV